VDNIQPKKRFPLGRVARLAFRTLALAMFVALLVGWIGSYHRGFAVYRFAKRALIVTSYCGHLALNLYNYPGLPSEPEWGYTVMPREAWIDESWRTAKPFQLGLDGSGWIAYVTAPYWFLTTLAAMAAALSFKRTWRFTTRQLLLATTAVALLLGAAAWSMRG
jgi:hypothetical protein